MHAGPQPATLWGMDEFVDGLAVLLVIGGASAGIGYLIGKVIPQLLGS